MPGGAPPLHTKHPGRGQAAPPPQQHGQFVLTPVRVSLPQTAHSFGLVPDPGRLPPMPGPVRTVFQRAQVPGIVAWLPAIKCLPSDPEMATSQGHLPSVGIIVVEPDQPFASLPAQLGRPRSRNLERGIPIPLICIVTLYTECQPSF